jgi:AcrR family transcriptional regulator
VLPARGVAATSVDDIVETAGVAKGTCYLYFPTKDDAVTAVAERMVIGVAERVECLDVQR